MGDGDERQDLPDDAMVTQTGQHTMRRKGSLRVQQTFDFRSGLRPDRGESYVSVIEGRRPPAEVVPWVNRGDAAGSADAVRYARVEDLRRQGFSIKYKPSRTVPHHVSVAWDGEWDENVLLHFDKCFTDYVAGPG